MSEDNPMFENPSKIPVGDVGSGLNCDIKPKNL